MNPDLLKILRCPETHQPLKLADAALVENLNQKIAAGQLRNRAGSIVCDKLDAALLRNDGKALYPVRGSLPILLIDESISVE